MRQQSTAKENPAAGLSDFTPVQLPWVVVEAKALPGFRIQVRFVDGLSGTVDMSGLVNSRNAGVFTQLSDPEKFKQVFVDSGAVAWPGEIDLAPDAMHAHIKEKGEWKLTGLAD